MRRLGILLVLLLVACGSSPKGPAWPERQEPEEDGGESLEPHASAVAIEASRENEPSVELADIVEDALTISPATTTPSEAAEPAPEEVIMTEEITIEIEE